MGDCKAYHNFLLETNPKKYTKRVYDMILKSHLCGRARDLACIIPYDKIQSENGAFLIVNALHKLYFLAVLSTVYSKFNSLVVLSTCQILVVRTFKTRYASPVPKFNAYGDSLQLPEPIAAFMFMKSAGITNNHRVSILAAAAKDVLVGKAVESVDIKALLSDACLVKKVTHETVASILRQYAGQDDSLSLDRLLSANCGNVGRSRSSNQSNKNRIQRIKCKFSCRRCGNYGPWKDGYINDGSLKSETPGYDSSRSEK